MWVCNEVSICLTVLHSSCYMQGKGKVHTYSFPTVGSPAKPHLGFQWFHLTKPVWFQVLNPNCNWYKCVLEDKDSHSMEPHAWSQMCSAHLQVCTIQTAHHCHLWAKQHTGFPLAKLPVLIRNSPCYTRQKLWVFLLVPVEILSSQNQSSEIKRKVSARWTSNKARHVRPMGRYIPFPKCICHLKTSPSEGESKKAGRLTVWS